MPNTGQREHKWPALMSTGEKMAWNYTAGSRLFSPSTLSASVSFGGQQYFNNVECLPIAEKGPF